MTNTTVAANVMIIEDDVVTADALCLQLLRHGFGTRQTHSRDEALEVLSQYLYDFIVMDYYMAGLGAKDFVNEVRKRSPRTEIILITVDNDSANIAVSLGIQRYLKKPFKPDELMALLST